MQCSVDLATELQVSRSAINAISCCCNALGTESDRTPESRVQRVSTIQPETVASRLPHVTSRHDHQRVPHSFRQQPTSSTRREIRQRAPLVQQTRNRQDTGCNSAPLPCLPCICSVFCAQLAFTLEPANGLCNTHDECACEYRLKTSAV